MRFICREDARRRSIPREAVVVTESLEQISFLYQGWLRVLSFIKIREACEDCGTMWWVRVDFEIQMKVLMEKAGQ